jgi:hypothetical protein
VPEELLVFEGRKYRNSQLTNQLGIARIAFREPSVAIPGSAVLMFRTAERGMLKTTSSSSKSAVATEDRC